MKFLIFCGVVATILIMCAGCETPAPKKAPCYETIPAPVEGINKMEGGYKCSNYYKAQENKTE
tara:strand:+ start:1173 stop:1361 length:189 start_codon:yes stop_codon:yes gene_type:complete